MNDAIALLAISQLVCLAGLGYLYIQLQALRRDRIVRRPPASRIRPLEGEWQRRDTASNRAAASLAYGASRPNSEPAAADLGDIAARVGELGLDIPALARRMRRSEEEVRLLLRRQGVAR